MRVLRLSGTTSHARHSRPSPSRNSRTDIVLSRSRVVERAIQDAYSRFRSRSANSSDWCRAGERADIAGPMSDAEIVITFQSERDLWYVQRGDATAMVSAEDMVHEYYRWRHAGAPGVWGDRARPFCRACLDRSPSPRPASGR